MSQANQVTREHNCTETKEVLEHVRDQHPDSHDDNMETILRNTKTAESGSLSVKSFVGDIHFLVES